MATADNTMSPSFCTQCGTPIPAGAKFCPRCGTAVTPIDRSAYETGDSNKNVNRASYEGKLSSKKPKKDKKERVSTPDNSSKQGRKGKRSKHAAGAGDAYGTYPKINPNAGWFSNFAYCLKNSKQTMLATLILVLLILLLMFLDYKLPGGKMAVEHHTPTEPQVEQQTELPEESETTEPQEPTEEEKPVEEFGENKEKDEKPEEKDEKSEYVLPDSSTRKLSASDVAGLSKEELRLARNEIYARHGRMFRDEALQKYFDSKSWYVRKYGPDEFDAIQNTALSEIEKYNIELIKSFE